MAWQPVLGLTARHAEAESTQAMSLHPICPQKVKMGRVCRCHLRALPFPEGSPEPGEALRRELGAKQSDREARLQCHGLAAPHSASGWPRPQPGCGHS